MSGTNEQATGGRMDGRTGVLLDSFAPSSFLSVKHLLQPLASFLLLLFWCPTHLLWMGTALLPQRVLFSWEHRSKRHRYLLCNL